jgi:signal transduction histidine kinase
MGTLLENTRLNEEITLKEEMERRLNTFSSIASHELRTPATTIMGFTELLMRRDPPSDVRQDWLERVYQASRRLSSIVDDLMDVSRVQSGKMTVNSEPTDLRDVLVEVLHSIVPTTSRHTFQTDIPEGTPHVLADWDKLGQVLTNLLDNAVKYSPPGGTITVSASHEVGRGRVVVAVADQGIGIAPGDRERLFTTFHRIRRPEIAETRGTGLGLYIVRELLELMGGQVWVESELNVGSRFTFSIPGAYEGAAAHLGTGLAGC